VKIAGSGRAGTRRLLYRVTATISVVDGKDPRANWASGARGVHSERSVVLRLTFE